MTWEQATIFIGGIATLSIFSFLFFGENKLFRFFEHIYIGIAAGFLSIYTIRNQLWSIVLEPMLGLDIVVFPDGTTSKAYNAAWLLYLIPMGIGALYYTIYSKRYQWLSKIAIGFSLGAAGGLAFKAFFNEIWPQITSSFRPLVVLSEGGSINWSASAENSLFVLILLCVMSYFFFTFRTTGVVYNRVMVSGRWLMMISFGAFFGSTVMARMSLLIERLQFLITQWFPLVKGWFN